MVSYEKIFGYLPCFKLQEGDELRAELKPLIHRKDLPPVLLSTVYTLHAKYSFIDGNEAEGKLFTNKATQLIKAINEVSVSPRRYSEVVVLQTYAKDWEGAKRFGLWAEKRMANIQNHQSLTAFNTAMGHVYKHFKEFDNALYYYSEALKRLSG